MLYDIDKIIAYNNIEENRKEIEKTDIELLNLLKKRFELSKKIWLAKKVVNMNIKQNWRWESLLEKNINYWKKIGLTDNFVNDIYERIHQESISIQKNI